MRRLISISAIAILVMVLSACTPGPKFTEIKPDLTAPNPDMGRIFFYRPRLWGEILPKCDRTEVRLNGERVGTTKCQGFFYVDRPAGHYTVAFVDYKKKKVSFTLDKGQTLFIRFYVKTENVIPPLWLGSDYVYGKLVDEPNAKAEIVDCEYIGQMP